MSLTEWILTVAAAMVSIPSAVLACEVFAAIWPRRVRPVDATQPRARCAVLMPAHNEAGGIGETIAILRLQLHATDRLVVVADNCEDLTANVARQAGAEVIERQDAQRRGKGFALDFGLQHLQTDPPEIVVLIDADTRVHPGALDRLIRDAHKFQTPTQGVFTDAPKCRGPREQWSAFALTFKNLVRPLGLYRLGLPCLLYGSGMAFPWSVLRKANLGTGNIVEDMKLGIDLTLAGHPARFCPDARFESDDAPNLEAATTRRTRWEHGHVFTMLSQVPRLMFAGISQGRFQLIALALELAIPPLSLLFLMQAFLVGICLILWQLGGSIIPTTIISSAAFVGATAILAGWRTFGRRLLSPKILCLLPIYVLWKMPIYLKLLIAPQRNWIRTERKPAA